MARGKTSEKAAILKRQALALDLRIQGMPYRKIAERLGVEVGTAFSDVKNEMALLGEMNQGAAEDLRQLSLDRLDVAIAGATPFVQAGSANHISAYAAAIEKQAKIAGIIKPPEIVITINLEIVQRFESTAKELGIDPAQALEEYIQALHAQSVTVEKSGKASSKSRA